MTDMPEPIDLTTLANLPGAGKAAAALEEADLRLPDIPEGHELYRIEITVSLTRSATVTMLVAAEDAQAAVQFAEERAEDHDGPWSDEAVEIEGRACQPLTEQEAAALSARERRRIEVDW